MKVDRPILSPMQEWIASLIHEGWTNPQIAIQTHTSAGTVRNVTMFIYRKVVPGEFSGNRRVYLAIWVEKHKCAGTWPPMKAFVEDNTRTDVYEYPKKGKLLQGER